MTSYVENLLNSRREIVLIMGAPGSGKGTQSENLKKQGYTHISTGDLFRAVVKYRKINEYFENKVGNSEVIDTKNLKEENEIKKVVSEFDSYLKSINLTPNQVKELAGCVTSEDIAKMNNGHLMSDSTAVNIVLERIKQLDNPNRILLDGFPRSVNQAKALDRTLKEKGQKVTRVLNLEVPDEIVVGRILERGRMSGRVDDRDEQTVKKRLDSYHKNTKPVLEHYSRQNRGVVINIDGKQTPEKVSCKIQHSLTSRSIEL